MNYSFPDRSKILLVLFFVFCYSDISIAQSFKYRRYNLKWQQRRPEPIAVEDQFKNEDAVILEEENVIGLSGNVCRSHIRIKFLTQKGIDKYSKFVLPTGFDPVGDSYSINVRRRDTLYRPKGEFECIRYFAARIIKPGGDVEDAVVDESTQKETVLSNHLEEQYFSWIFKIQRLKSGDEVEVEYAFEKTFNTAGATVKFFFNGIFFITFFFKS